MIIIFCMLCESHESGSIVSSAGTTVNMDNFFEGDIILTPDQKEIMESSTEEEEGEHVNKRAVQKNLSDKWENGVVPYVIASGLRKQFLEKTIS